MTAAPPLCRRPSNAGLQGDLGIPVNLLDNFQCGGGLSQPAIRRFSALDETAERFDFALPGKVFSRELPDGCLGGPISGSIR